MEQKNAPVLKDLKETMGKIKLLGLGSSKSDREQSMLEGPTTQNKNECRVCSNYMLPPIYQCYNGHTLCHECEPTVQKCPEKTCRGLLPKKTKKIRSLVLEEIVTGLKFDCQNHRFGCPVENLRFDQITDHASRCLFAEISYCEQLGLNCKEKCTRAAIASHLKSAHPKILRIDLTSVEDNIPLFLSIQGVPDLNVKKVCTVPAYMEWGGQTFFMKSAFNYEENCCSWMICTGGGSGSVGPNARKSDCDFVARITLSSIHSQENSIEWSGEIGKLCTPFGYNEFSFNVPLETIKIFAKASTSGRRNGPVEWRVDVRLLKRNRPPPRCS